MLKSIHKILLVTLRDVITYKMGFNRNLENSCQPSVQYTFVLSSESSLPGEEPAGPCQRRLPQWQTDRCLLLPAWSSPASACLPVPCICLTLTGTFSFCVAVCSYSLSLAFLHSHLFAYTILDASAKASKSLLLVTAWRILIQCWQSVRPSSLAILKINGDFFSWFLAKSFWLID